MKIVDRLKHWVGIDQIEDAILLSRYGAKSMDELWGMILAGRSAEPSRVTVAKNFKLTMVSKAMHEKDRIKKNGLRYRKKEQNESALVQYQNHLRDKRMATRAYQQTQAKPFG